MLEPAFLEDSRLRAALFPDLTVVFHFPGLQRSTL